MARFSITLASCLSTTCGQEAGTIRREFLCYLLAVSEEKSKRAEFSTTHKQRLKTENCAVFISRSRRRWESRLTNLVTQIAPWQTFKSMASAPYRSANLSRLTTTGNQLQHGSFSFEHSVRINSSSRSSNSGTDAARSGLTGEPPQGLSGMQMPLTSNCPVV